MLIDSEYVGFNPNHAEYIRGMHAPLHACANISTLGMNDYASEILFTHLLNLHFQ